MLDALLVILGLRYRGPNYLWRLRPDRGRQVPAGISLPGIPVCRAEGAVMTPKPLHSPWPWVVASVLTWAALVGLELAVVEWLTRPETEEVGR